MKNKTELLPAVRETLHTALLEDAGTPQDGGGRGGSWCHRTKVFARMQVLLEKEIEIIEEREYRRAEK